ncbi:hypothetical protein BDN72DRAFT_879398 [Pluteus cervinus]|uniref:Uncharacterized protein n=1 Tax=Pluteus cervinus TaxID=181527 RepID=A0ACD3AQM1_9AGAR|nr:hypothetical protein BDN72DRAFT_879398 [Pluteus cervinus]
MLPHSPLTSTFMLAFLLATLLAAHGRPHPRNIRRDANKADGRTYPCSDSCTQIGATAECMLCGPRGITPGGHSTLSLLPSSSSLSLANDDWGSTAVYSFEASLSATSSSAFWSTPTLTSSTSTAFVRPTPGKRGQSGQEASWMNGKEA